MSKAADCSCSQQALPDRILGAARGGYGSNRNFENPVAPVYVDGVKTVTLKGDNIAAEFQTLVEQYVRRNYAPERVEQPANMEEAAER